MIRWPYSWRRPEGVNNGIPKIRVLHYKLDCLFENIYIRLSRLPKECLNNENREESLTISLTTFPARINKTYFAIKSLMLQSYKADRIVLWLAEEQFPEKRLPKEIERLVDRGLEICWCDDLRSHKKYFYALQQQKENELVVTYDDDIIYERDSIEKLITAHNEHPSCIVCNRAHELTFSKEGELLPYDNWKIHSETGVTKPAMNLMPSTGNGCLYPYGCMPPITFDWEIIKQNALTADDVWMRYCSYSNGVPILKTRETIAILCNVWGSQRERLTQLNDCNGENQRVIDRLNSVFPDIIKES